MRRQSVGFGCRLFQTILIQVRAHNQGVVEFYRRIGYTVDDHVSLGKLLSPE